MDLGATATELTRIVGAEHVLSDPDLTVRHVVDWTGRRGGHRAVVVRPGSTGEVAAVVAWAATAGIPIVPQGGNTGLVGGSVPGADGWIVLSTERLARLDDLDLDAGHVTAGAGVTPAVLAGRLAGSGWRFAVDLGSRGSATIGGMVATNAGGMRVFRFGAMRAQLLGLEYVTAEGHVVSRLAGLEKDNTGYDLTSLLCGSEGTLAVVTAARLRLVADPPERATAMLGFATAAEARSSAWALRRSVAPIEVVEYLTGECLDVVAEVVGAARPVAAPHVVLVEAAATTDPSDELAAGIEALGDVVVEVAVAVDSARRAALWRFRDELTTTLATLGPVVKYDLSVTSAEVDAFRADADAAVAALAPGARTWWFGHVCDDNIHLNVTGATADTEALDALDAAVLASIAAHRGSISAEHGIGRTKARFLHLARSEAEIAQMRAIKTAFDPRGILNPGVLFG